MRRSLTTLVAALLAASVLAGCGGGGSKTSSTTPLSSDSPSSALSTKGSTSTKKSGSEFTQAANKACETRADAYIAAEEELDTKYKRGSIEWAAGNAALLVKVDEARLAALKDLTPPSKLRDAFEAYVSVLEDKLEQRKDAQQAVADSDQAAYQEALKKDGATDDEQRSTARAAGLDACSGDALSDDDVAEIERVVKTTGTQSDPDYCTDAFTEGFVFQQFGSADDCEAAQSQPASFSSVSVSDPYGVGDYADITVEAHPADGSGTEKGFAVLYRQDGHWRMQSVDLQS
jgi:hypothetical protein